MSKPIDTNKATLEEFTSITGIGEKRAQKILNKDLKLITCIPSTIWGPLIETGEIMIELPSNPEGGQTHETQLIDKNVIQKIANTIDILTTELDTLKQDKNNMKSTYDKEIHYLTLDFKTKMKNKEHEYEQQIREYKKQQKEQFDAFFAESKERDEHLLREIVLRNINLKQLEESKENVIPAKQKVTITSELKESWEKPKYKWGQDKYFKTDCLMPPKMSTYNGKNDWRPYCVQFNHIANRHSWTKQQRLDK
jgi:hypothetical protein